MLRATLLFPALFLTACATQQENPIYQYSSVYDQTRTGAATQAASYRDVAPQPVSEPVSEPAPQNAPVYSRVDGDCVALDPSLGTCQPVGVAETQAPVVSAPWSSPTEERFAGGDATPGFRALEGSLAGGPDASPTPVPAPVPSFEAEAPTAREELPTLTISGPIHAAESLSGTQSHALMHRVEPGDTVYGLARRYCADVELIRSMNGLDAGYAIRLGQDLKLPANCQ